MKKKKECEKKGLPIKNPPRKKSSYPVPQNYENNSLGPTESEWEMARGKDDNSGSI
jgi:hypothetical protein